MLEEVDSFSVLEVNLVTFFHLTIWTTETTIKMINAYDDVVEADVQELLRTHRHLHCGRKKSDIGIRIEF